MARRKNPHQIKTSREKFTDRLIMLNQLTISELTAKLARREVSAREATQACLDQIARVDGKIHAFLSFNAADALAQADTADHEISSGVTKPLLGVPIAI